MNTILASTRSLAEMFSAKVQEFADHVDSTSMVWLEEIQQEANRMFSSDFNAEPELMPKTPSQKKRTRRKRVSMGQEESRAASRFSKGKRSNLRTSSVRTLTLVSEDAGDPGAPEEEEEKPKRSTRRNHRQKQPEQGDADTPKSSRSEEAEGGPGQAQAQACLDAPALEAPATEGPAPEPQSPPSSPPRASPANAVPVVRISEAERLSAELHEEASTSAAASCRSATKLAIARAPEAPAGSRRSSVRRSLVLRRSLAGLRHSMTQESVRRASRRSFLKKKARMSGSTCSSSASLCVEMDEEKAGKEMDDVLENPAESATEHVDPKVGEDVAIPRPSSSEVVRRFTRSMAQTVPTPPQKPKNSSESSSPQESVDGGKKPAASASSLRSKSSVKRKAAEAAEELPGPSKKASPPKKSQSAMRPHMKTFLHTVQKNQLLMMTPGSLSRSTVVKSFIKHTTPLRVDVKPGAGLVERERLRLEALKKKQEQEIERKKKLDEEKRKKQEEMKRKRDERLRKVVEARVKEEQREEEKKKKIEQKMAHMEEKNDKLRVERLAEEKAKRKVATKRQEELEQRKKQEEEARKRKILQAEEEKKQQELLAKRRVEEELDRARRLAEARRALEQKKHELEREREEERQRELLRQQQAAAAREKAERERAEQQRAEQEKALALQRELQKAAEEKQQREAEERKRQEERQKQLEREKAAAVAAAERNVVAMEMQKSVMKTPIAKAAGANVTIDIEKSIMKTPVGKVGLVTMDVEKSVMKTPMAKAAGANVTIDIEQSPQSYEITPKAKKPVVVSANPEDYGMDQNSDDSTDDESAPRKPIPSWAEGRQLQQAMLQQYFNPVDVDAYFGLIAEPKLDQIFNKSKPRYFKRTSSAVWLSPPRAGHTAF